MVMLFLPLKEMFYPTRYIASRGRCFPSREGHSRAHVQYPVYWGGCICGKGGQRDWT